MNPLSDSGVPCPARPGDRVRRIIVDFSIAVLLIATPCAAMEQTLDNGMRVVLIPHRANPMVASAVIVGAGVVDEPPQAAGASHFLEHLLFNGTTTRTQRQLYDEVDRLGAYNNATTREDHTLFTLLVAKEHAEEGLAIQADMLFRSTIPADSFEKERKIVLEELARDRSDPSYDREAAFRAAAYAGTPIERPVLGTESSLAGITRAQVVGYYKARYVPGNMTLVVMGDFDPPDMLAAVKRTFGAAPKGAVPKAVAARWPAAPKENVTVASVKDGPPRLIAAFPFPAAPWDRTTAAGELLLAAASDGPDSPFALALKQRGVAAPTWSAGIERRRTPWSTVVLEVELADGAVDPAPILAAFQDALNATAPGGGARARLDPVLAGSEADAVIARDQIHYYAMMHASSILGAPAGTIGDEARMLASLSREDWDAASSLLTSGLTSVRARMSGPGLSDARTSWSPASGTGTAASSSAVRAGTLANGLRYVVRQTSDSDVFALHLAFAPRAAGEPACCYGITDLLHRMMVRGTVMHDEASMSDRLSRLGAHVKAFDDPSVPFDDYYTTPEFSWMRVEVPSAQWREALGVAAEMVRFPALTPGALEAARREVRERVARRDSSPRDAAAGALDQLLAPGHPMTKPVYGTSASLGAITLADVKAYHDAFAVGRRVVASVVGPVPADDVVRALEADLGAMPEGAVPEAAAPVPVSSKSGAIEVAVGKTQSSLALGAVLDVAPEDRAALTIAVAILSDRLAFDLRETKGLAYSIGASVRPWGGRMRFDVAMGTRPENIDTAREGILSGIRSFRESAPSAADVSRAINVARGAALMRRMTRISLAYEAGLEAIRGREPGDERRFVDSLAGVRAEDVSRVAAAYLDPERLSIAVAR
jgi:zinc protease